MRYIIYIMLTDESVGESMRATVFGLKSEDASRINLDTTLTHEIVGGSNFVISDDNHNKLRAQAISDGANIFKNWFKNRSDHIKKIKGLFNNDGVLLDNNDKYLSATTFSDLYKWTMLPVIRTLETCKNNGSVIVTFGIDLRDDAFRTAVNSDIKLREAIHASLTKLTMRKFNKQIFTDILVGPLENIIQLDDVASICGNDESPRVLVDRVNPINDISGYNNDDIINKRVIISFYKNEDACYKPGEKGVYFIEATGPWNRVTWLETTMMQCVYETKLRYDLEKTGKSYTEWLDDALLRCAKSIAYTRIIQKQFPEFRPALFTGRRTGGLLFLVLQNMMFADHFKQHGTILNGAIHSTYIETGFDKTYGLGTSSCDSWYILKQLGLPCLNPIGTHAHELSMVASVLFPQLDYNNRGLPITQILGHYLYYKLIGEKTGMPMPMLPDTIGTRAFMIAANCVKVNNNIKFIDLVKIARQDSGSLTYFKQIVGSLGFNGPTMASEIDTTSTLLMAANLQYSSFGAGGFFGDSEKVWSDKSIPSNSMAAKAIRVQYTNIHNTHSNYHNVPYIKLFPGYVIGYPVKIGDPISATNIELTGCKLSLDKNLDPSILEEIKQYFEGVRTSNYTAVDSVNIEDILRDIGIVV